MELDRRSRALLAATTVVVLGGLAQAGSASPPPGEAFVKTARDPSTEALLATLEKTPARPTRVLVTTRPDAIDRVADAARRAGAHVERIAGQPLLVVEGLPAHLRAALGTGCVVRMQRDDAAPTN